MVKLGYSVEKNLHYFDKLELFDELIKVQKWYNACGKFEGISIDYRIKSIQSAMLKYKRYYPHHQMVKGFNDLLGFGILCDNYEDILQAEYDNIRVADLSGEKSRDDEYRGVHVYFQRSNFHYPIEIPYNTYYDCQLNNWLHKYGYKRKYNNQLGYSLRQEYESGNMKNESEFKEVLERVLSDCKEVW